MVRLDPCMIRTLHFGDIEVQFLDGSRLYFTRKVGIGRKEIEYHCVTLGQSLKTSVLLSREDFPTVPVKPVPTVDLRLVRLGFWLLQCSNYDRHMMRNFEMYFGNKQFRDISCDEGRCVSGFEISDDTLLKAQEYYDLSYQEQLSTINKNWINMIVLSQEDSSLVANVFAYKGESKKLVQGLQALGVNVNLVQNYLTEGISNLNLEEEILRRKDREIS